MIQRMTFGYIFSWTFPNKLEKMQVVSASFFGRSVCAKLSEEIFKSHHEACQTSQLRSTVLQMVCGADRSAVSSF